MFSTLQSDTATRFDEHQHRQHSPRRTNPTCNIISFFSPQQSIKLLFLPRGCHRVMLNGLRVIRRNCNKLENGSPKMKRLLEE